MTRAASGWTRSRSRRSSADEGLGVVSAKDAGDQRLDVPLMAPEGLIGARPPERGEGRERPPPVVGAACPANEASVRESVDGAGQPAGREASLRREVGHPQPGAGGAFQAHEHLEGEPAQAQLGFDPRGEGSAQAPGRLEHEPGERDPGGP